MDKKKRETKTATKPIASLEKTGGERTSGSAVPIALFLLSLLLFSSIIILRPLVFVYDESTYATMANELNANPGQIVPTITGEKVEWKPPLFFWVSSAFLSVLKPIANSLALPVETPFRLPSALFGALSVWLVFLVSERMYGRRTAIAAALMFMTVPLVMLMSSLMMLDMFAVMLSLAAIYTYVSGRVTTGSVLLGAVVLTKWLYVIVPAIFVLMYFLHPRRRSEASRIALSFVSIPLAILLYLALAFVFGNFGNALTMLFLDITRPMPTFSLVSILVTALTLFIPLFPVIFLALMLLIFSKRIETEEWPLLACGALLFIMPVFKGFIFWYALITVPALVILVAKRIMEEQGNLPYILLCCVLLLQVVGAYGPLTQSHFANPDMTQVAGFMKNKEVAFAERDDLSWLWWTINKEYLGTNRSYLLLEQNNPGFLFYRFNDSEDYWNVHPVFLALNETIDCSSPYLVVHSSQLIGPALSENEVAAMVPACYQQIDQTENFRIYERR